MEKQKLNNYSTLMILNLINNRFKKKKRFLVNTTEALVTIGRIWQVVNIVVTTVEHLDWSRIVLGVAWTLKVNCSRNYSLGHSWVAVKQVTWGVWAEDMMLPFGMDFKFLTWHFAILRLQMFFAILTKYFARRWKKSRRVQLPKMEKQQLNNYSTFFILNLINSI